jgi:ATP adenylyltransferase
MKVIRSLKEAQEEGLAPWTNIVNEDEHYVVFLDKYPVTEGHMLFVPKDPSLQGIEIAFRAALETGNENVGDNGITGYNIGINVGESAGQTVMYPHVHLIFRRDGDMEDPRGGVRGVIPEKQKY